MKNRPFKQILALVLSANLMLCSCTSMGGGGYAEDDDEILITEDEIYPEEEYESESTMQSFATSVAMPVVFVAGVVTAGALFFWGITHMGNDR